MIVELEQDYVAKIVRNHLVRKYQNLGGLKRDLLNNLEVSVKLKKSGAKVKLIQCYPQGKEGRVDKFKYAIETLTIEKYRLIALCRQLKMNEHEGRVSFSEELKQVVEDLDQVEAAIKKLA